jgi:hypothetical protein
MEPPKLPAPGGKDQGGRGPGLTRSPCREQIGTGRSCRRRPPVPGLPGGRSPPGKVPDGDASASEGSSPRSRRGPPPRPRGVGRPFRPGGGGPRRRERALRTPGGDRRPAGGGNPGTDRGAPGALEPGDLRGDGVGGLPPAKRRGVLRSRRVGGGGGEPSRRARWSDHRTPEPGHAPERGLRGPRGGSGSDAPPGCGTPPSKPAGTPGRPCNPHARAPARPPLPAPPAGAARTDWLRAGAPGVAVLAPPMAIRLPPPGAQLSSRCSGARGTGPGSGSRAGSGSPPPIGAGNRRRGRGSSRRVGRRPRPRPRAVPREDGLLTAPVHLHRAGGGGPERFPRGGTLPPGPLGGRGPDLRLRRHSPGPADRK